MSASETIRSIQFESSQQRRAEVENEVQRLKSEQKVELERLTDSIRRDMEEEHSNQVSLLNAKHKTELDRIKSELGVQSSKRLEAELQKLKQRHMSDLDRVRKEAYHNLEQFKTISRLSTVHGKMFLVTIICKNI